MYSTYPYITLISAFKLLMQLNLNRKSPQHQPRQSQQLKLLQKPSKKEIAMVKRKLRRLGWVSCVKIVIEVLLLYCYHATLALAMLHNYAEFKLMSILCDCLLMIISYTWCFNVNNNIMHPILSFLDSLHKFKKSERVV